MQSQITASPGDTPTGVRRLTKGEQETRAARQEALVASRLQTAADFAVLDAAVKSMAQNDHVRRLLDGMARRRQDARVRSVIAGRRARSRQPLNSTPCPSAELPHVRQRRTARRATPTRGPDDPPLGALVVVGGEL